MRVAAVDFGTARIGLAVSDELGMLAHPRPAVRAGNPRAAIEALRRTADDERIDRFLVGLPLEMRGAEGAAARRVRAFAQKLADGTGREVELVDERLTTVQAMRRLREGQGKVKRQRVDGAAAAIMLQAWLDRQRASEPR
jgi:putative Holliday junction resolvase